MLDIVLWMEPPDPEHYDHAGCWPSGIVTRNDPIVGAVVVPVILRVDPLNVWDMAVAPIRIR